jgi:hypothetical protein
MDVPMRSSGARAILRFLSKTKTLCFCNFRKFWKRAARMLAFPHFANPAWIMRRDLTWAASTRRLAIWLSEFFRIFQQLDHPFEQTAGAAAIDAAMIKTQRDLGFGPGKKLLLLFIP